MSFSISKHWPDVRAISFDLDDTLWPILPAIENAENRLWQWLDTHFPRITQVYDVAGLREHRNTIGQTYPELAHDLAGMRRRALEALLEDFDYAHDWETASHYAEAGWRIFYAERNCVNWYADAQPALQRLQNHYQLAATTNGNADLDIIGGADYFAAQLHAGKVGAAKPDAPMWQALCAALKLQPEQILHIGDHPEHDVMGALNHGLNAIWLNREQQQWPQERNSPTSIQSLAELQL